MEFKKIIVEKKAPLAYITLNRPDTLNAFDIEMMEELCSAFTDFGSDKKIKVVIIKHKGKVFCCGHSLQEAINENAKPAAWDVSLRLVNIVRSIPQPVIAQVNNTVVAGGMEFVESCDIVTATTDSRFATPGIKSGLACFTAINCVSRNINRKKAFEMLLTGEFVYAEEALRVGLVNHIAEPDKVDETTEKIANIIASYSRDVIGMAKRFFYRQLEMHDDISAMDYGTMYVFYNTTRDFGKEGINAFLEKRKPNWD